RLTETYSPSSRPTPPLRCHLYRVSLPSLSVLIWAVTVAGSYRLTVMRKGVSSGSSSPAFGSYRPECRRQQTRRERNSAPAAARARPRPARCRGTRAGTGCRPRAGGRGPGRPRTDATAGAPRTSPRQVGQPARFPLPLYAPFDPLATTARSLL